MRKGAQLLRNVSLLNALSRAPTQLSFLSIAGQADYDEYALKPF
ncbi:hypothetical protein BJ885_4142 [Enterobacter sp. WP_7_1]|nr:hypothetical protein BJ885_4142 [Enterobacter sp. WP_7_1]RMA90076.1 hypothetical protein BJ886_4256 [Enterobacter sp. WP_7_2]